MTTDSTSLAPSLRPLNGRRPSSTWARVPLAVLCVVAAAATFTGCANTFGLVPQAQLMPASKVRADVAIQGVQVSSAAWPSENWWEAFGDQQLNQLVSEALADSPTLRMASARVRQAMAIEELAEASLQPRVDASLSSVRQRFSSHGTTPHPVAGTVKTVNQGVFSGSYEIDFWGENAEAVEASVGHVKAADVDRQAVRLMVSSAVVQAYIGLDQIAQQLDVEQRLLEQQLKILGLTRRRLAAEIDSKVDLTLAEASIPATRANIAALKEALELSRNRIATLLGKGPDRGQTIELPHMKFLPSASVPSSLTADLIGRRPDVVAQRWRVEASAHDIKVAKAKFYPNVSISAFLGLQSLGFPEFDVASSRILGVGPAMTLPIFDGGRLRANLAGQDAAYDLAVEAYNQTILDAVQDIADQLSSLRWLQERLTEQRLAVTTAAEAELLSQERFAGGLGNYVQVLIAQDAVLAQRLQLVQLESRAISLQANLSRALGGGYMPSTDPQGAPLLKLEDALP